MYVMSRSAVLLPWNDLSGLKMVVESQTKKLWLMQIV